eukprot:TRINITY_DN1246_c0_g1_i1.p1 TRINITY_DN1246_c0_g1~~TRINITY_DN1246_c0_g1_i1.p1  ORF type:complete len:1072 (-),score=242.65 TRINITY_DN1246_c0_g1_i1:50-3265(-)
MAKRTGSNRDALTKYAAKPLPPPQGGSARTNPKTTSKEDQDDFWGTTPESAPVQQQQPQQTPPPINSGGFNGGYPPGYAVSPQSPQFGQRSYSQGDVMNPYMMGQQQYPYGYMSGASNSFAAMPPAWGYPQGYVPAAGFVGGFQGQTSYGAPAPYPGAFQGGASFGGPGSFQGGGSYGGAPVYQAPPYSLQDSGNPYNAGPSHYVHMPPVPSSDGVGIPVMAPQLHSPQQPQQSQQSLMQQPVQQTPSQPPVPDKPKPPIPVPKRPEAADGAPVRVATELLQKPSSSSPVVSPSSQANAAEAAKRNNLTPTVKRNILMNQHRFAQDFGAQSLRRKVSKLSEKEQEDRDARRQARAERRAKTSNDGSQKKMNDEEVKAKLKKVMDRKPEPTVEVESHEDQEERIRKAVEARIKEQEELMLREVEERVKREEAERRRKWEEDLLRQKDEEAQKFAEEQERIFAEIEKEKLLRNQRESEMKLALEEEKKRRQEVEEEIHREQERKKKELEEIQKQKQEKKKQEMLQVQQNAQENAAKRIQEQQNFMRQSFNPEALKRQIEARLREELAAEQRAKEEAQANARKNEKFVWEFSPGDVTMDKELGRGAYGVVYAGRLHGKRVAVKKLLMGDGVDEEVLTSFKVEVDIMNKLRHPNILLFMGACFQPENCMLVTEIMPRGSLDNIIHNEAGTPIPFRLRMRFAKDTVLGMNWLHRLHPPFLHLDLKLGNLLVDENWNVKVADFGLSKIAPDCVIESEGLIGSPFYMAPEMLMEKDYNEKADIYSFAICLWEIYTTKFPYEGMFNELDELVMAVAMDEERPEIPADCPVTLRDLIESCWATDPKSRPSFRRILKASLFDSIIIEDAIQDAKARDFWKTKFIDQSDTIRFEEFFEDYLEYFNINPLLLPSISPKVRAFAAVLAPKANPGQVTLATFGHAVEVFGPIQTGVDLVETAATICAKPWFWGEMNKDEAELILGGKRSGGYLIRFSASAPGTYTLTIQYKKKKFRHLRIVRSADKKHFVYNSKNYASIDDFISMHAQQLNLKTPCSPSPFAALFVEKKPGTPINQVYGSYTLVE